MFTNPSCGLAVIEFLFRYTGRIKFEQLVYERVSDHLCIGYRRSQAYQKAFRGVDTHFLDIYDSLVPCI